MLSELRMIGPNNCLTKLFVDESLTCESPIELHMYDVLTSTGKPLPCFYCGDCDEQNLHSKLTDEKFPLCKYCHLKGRGAGCKRKSRKVKPKLMKPKKPAKPTKKMPKKRVQLIL